MGSAHWHRSFGLAWPHSQRQAFDFPKPPPHLVRGSRCHQLHERLPFESRKYPGVPVRWRSKRANLRRRFDPSAVNSIHRGSDV